MLDFSTPVMNGLDVASALKRLMPEVPIVMFSAYADSFTEKEARSAGVPVLVSKFEDIAVLVGIASNLFYPTPRLGQDGHSQFNRLMFKRGDPHFYAFDLLWLNGEGLRGWALLDRKREMRKIMPRGSRLLYVDHTVGREATVSFGVCRGSLRCRCEVETREVYGRRSHFVGEDQELEVHASVGREKLFEKRAG